MLEKILSQILIEQQLEAKNWISESSSIPREKGDFYTSALSDSMIKIITGIRRCGKSFLSLQKLPKDSWIYVNFDDERLAELKTEDLNSIYTCGLQINSTARYWIFDEIQNIKNWDLFINRLNRKKINLIVTGSNGKLLSKELSTHLTGRHLTIELFPLSFREYLAAKNTQTIEAKGIFTTEQTALIKKYFIDYLKDGGFPETLKLVNKGPYLRDLYNSILTRDIIQRYSLRSPSGLKAIARLLLNNLSKEISYKNLTDISQLGSMNTTHKYISYLNDCYLFFELECYSPKIRERLVRERKIYCIDTGLYNALQTTISENLGQQLENCVFIDLLRSGNEVFYYKTTHYEVDFLVTKDRNIKKIIQVCYDLSNPKTEKREIHGLIEASNKFNCDNLYLLTLEQEEDHNIQGKTIHILPVWKWFLLRSL